MNSIKNISIYFFSFLVTIIICDVFLYTSGIYPHNNTDYYTDIGKGIRPNFDYVYFNEGFSMGSTNKYNYYGTEYAIEKKDSVVRIALLGDSYVEGLQVFNRNHFNVVLEKKLSKKNVSVEVLNFGRSEFSLGNMLAYEKVYVHKFKPDIFIYFLSFSSLENEYTDPSMAKMVYSKDSTLIVNLSNSKTYLKAYKKVNFFLKKSSFMYMMNNSKRYFTKENINRLLFLNSKEKIKKNNPKELKKFSKLTVDILEKINRKNTILVWRHLKRPPKLFLNYIKENNYKFIDLSYSLDSMYQKGTNPTYWKVTDKIGHWNHEAHKVVGGEIYNYLINNEIEE